MRKIAMAGVLMLALVLPSNGYGEVNTFNCSVETNTLEHYNKILEAQKNNLKPNVRYSLGFIAICIGMYSDGLEHIHRASEGGHVAATQVLGLYYDKNQAFDDKKRANLKNTYEAIVYYRKAADQIEAIPSYPTGTTEDMEYIEYASMISYRVFTRLPALYFNIYFTMMKSIAQNGVSYSNTLEILQKMGDVATRCLRRLALAVWKEKKERVYRTQQIECRAYLDFVKVTYPLEDERIGIANNCTVNVTKCKEHKEILNPMGRAVKILFQELKKSPGLRVPR